MKIVTTKGASLERLLEEARRVTPKEPFCVGVHVSAAMYARLELACAVMDKAELPAGMEAVCNAVCGMPVWVNHMLADDQWVEKMSDGSYRAHGFESTGDRSSVS